MPPRRFSCWKWSPEEGSRNRYPVFGHQVATVKFLFRALIHAMSDLDILLHLFSDHSSSTMEICCKDVHPEAFEKLVEFLYKRTCNFTTCNVVPIWHTAKEYGVPNLERLASRYAQEQVGIESCCELFKHAKEHGFTSLKTQCLQLIATKYGFLA